MNQTTRTALLCIALFAAAAPADAGTNAPNAADARLAALYGGEWQWRLAERIEVDEGSSYCGSASLPRVDAATQQRHLQYWLKVMAGLRAIAPAALSPAERINYAVYRAQLAALIADQQFREYEAPVNSDNAFWSEMADCARKPLATYDDYRHYLERIADVPRYFHEQVANMRAGLARGFTPPQVTLLGRDASLRSVTEAKTPQDTVLYLPFKSMPASVAPAQQAALREQAARTIASTVQPAYGALLKFMQDEYFPGARRALGAHSLPDGAAYYQSRIVAFTTTALTAAEIHQIGIEEMAKIRAEMQGAMKQAHFDGDLPAFLAFLRSDPQFYARTPDELLMRAAYIAKKFDGKADRFFGRLPRRRFGIEPVAADKAPFYTAGRGGPGVYLLNTYNLPARALYSLPALTLHESAPGHAFQMPLAMEQQDRPPFRRAYISAFGEGWALYCERLGSEMGIYETPYEVFGMLSYQAWRAARLVVDTGIHAQGWTREQAQAYMHDNTALADHEIETEVDRYISWPGQALSYYLGEMEILKARRKAEAALGARFDLRAFHDTVLQLGSVPLPVLAARIDAFIAEGGKSPYPKTR